MKIRFAIVLCLLVLVSAMLSAQSVQVVPGTIAAGVSFRGLSVVDDQVIWMSGSRGTVCRSLDGGTAFTCITVPGHDSTEFRSLYAMDAQQAVIANTGSPAKILRTADGGQTWKEVYVNEHVNAFMDGMDFWDPLNGIAYGDPIDGRMLIVTTSDGGMTWQEVPEENCPQLLEGEASFAASGTGIRCFENGRVVIASGGIASRLFFSEDKGHTWRWVQTPIIQGKESTGIFSFDFRDQQRGVIVGGDYRNETAAADHVFFTNDGGNNWQQPSRATRGYMECVEYISENVLVAVGPTGADISRNSGLSWEPFSEEKKLHVIRKARNGHVSVACGGDRVLLIRHDK